MGASLEFMSVRSDLVLGLAGGLGDVQTGLVLGGSKSWIYSSWFGAGWKSRFTGACLDPELMVTGWELMVSPKSPVAPSTGMSGGWVLRSPQACWFWRNHLGVLELAGPGMSQGPVFVGGYRGPYRAMELVWCLGGLVLWSVEKSGSHFSFLFPQRECLSPY